MPDSDIGTDLVTGEKVTLGKDAIKLLYCDPMLDEEAMKQRIFRFKEGSPAIKQVIPSPWAIVAQLTVTLNA